MTNSKGFLNGNALKIIAAVTMLIDHIGYILFPKIIILRAIGRLSMPIFAFMIAEGCRYTKNKVRYLSMILGLAAVYQAAYFLYDHSTKMGILVTFSLSIIMVYAVQYFYKQLFAKDSSVLKKALSVLVPIAAFGFTVVFTKAFSVDYRIYGAMLPVFASLAHFPENAPPKLKRIDTNFVSVLLLGIGTVLLSIRVPMARLPIGPIIFPFQMFSVVSVLLLFFYNGKRGKHKMKYFFYIFYPVHLLILELIAIIVK